MDLQNSFSCLFPIDKMQVMTWKCTGVNDLTTITCVLMISHDALQQNLQPPSRLSVKLTIMYNETSNRI